MKKNILGILISLTSCIAYGQCNSGPFTLTATQNSCSSYTLTLSGASATAQIVWRRNGVPFDSSIRSSIPDTGLTVAGGNGSGSAADQFDVPIGLWRDHAGNLYVADQYNNRIQKFPPGSNSFTNATTVAGGNGQGSGANQLYDPNDVVFDTAGNMYVADAENNRVQKFAPGSTIGATVAGGNGQGNSATQFYFPTGIYLDSAGYLYVADFYNDRIQRFPPGSTSATPGVTVAGGQGGGAAANQLSGPSTLLVLGSGDMLVSDEFNGRIQKFPSGSLSGTNAVSIAGANGYGSAANQLASPQAIFVDAQNNLYVSDQSNNRVQMFPPGVYNGITVAGGNGAGGASDQLHYPLGVAVDSVGNVFVVDYQNARVQEWVRFTSIDTSIVVSTAGTYTAYVTDTASGCGGFLSSAVTITMGSGSILTQSICPGGAYSFGGNSLSAAGTYLDTLMTSLGCDSIVTLTLSVLPISASSMTQAICPGDSFIFGGHSLYTASTYFDTLTAASVNGCDSIISLTLTVYPLSSANLYDTLAAGDTLHIGAYSYFQSGVYTDTLTGLHGCDSIVTLHINVFIPATSVHVFDTICQGLSVSIGTHQYSATGNYIDTIPNHLGGDSIVILSLIVNPLPVVTLSWDSLIQDHELSGFDSLGFWCILTDPDSIFLKGGLPSGGIYSGAHVQNGTFYPNGSLTLDTIFYTYIDSNQCSAISSDSIYNTDCDGIISAQGSVSLNLYPNPNTGTFTLETSDAIGTEYSVTDVLGHIMMQQIVSSGTQVINMPNAAKGIYILTVKGMQPVRFVVVR